MKFVLALTVVAAGCTAQATTLAPVAPGVKRMAAAGASRSDHAAGKARPRRGLSYLPASRSLSRPAIAHNWSAVADCESGGNWQTNTGNGFFGGLQFTLTSWLGAGGGRFAPRADLATEAEQVDIAEKLLALQGVRAWPVCGRYL